MTTVLMNNTVNSRNKPLNIMKDINIVVLYMYAYAYFARLRRGRFSRNRLTSLDAPEKYEIIVQKSPN